jgi:hypothetical protein
MQSISSEVILRSNPKQCGVCSRKLIKANIAFLDQCSHFFCIDCILDWNNTSQFLFNSIGCPSCTKPYVSWFKFGDTQNDMIEEKYNPLSNTTEIASTFSSPILMVNLPSKRKRVRIIAPTPYCKKSGDFASKEERFQFFQHQASAMEKKKKVKKVKVQTIVASSLLSLGTAFG